MSDDGGELRQAAKTFGINSAEFWATAARLAQEPGEPFNRDTAVRHDLLHASRDFDAVAHHPELARRMPRLAQALINLAQRSALIAYTLDITMAAPAPAEADATAEAAMLKHLADAVEEVRRMS